MIKNMSNFSVFVLIMTMSLGLRILLVRGENINGNMSGYDFPSGFVFGAASSAYQMERAVDKDGRTPSIWDTFAHSGYMNGATGDIACDVYHKYKEDVQLMVETGLDAFRFSISWSRLIPNGRGPVNPMGLRFYNNFIDELVSHGIQPHVTLHHVDLPQVLEDEYGGWISRKIVKDFVEYADVCFREFGDRVKHWTTINKANVFTLGGYDLGFQPPARCSRPFGVTECSTGNSSTEPYIAGHHMLLAHASAARLYEKNYKDKQHGFIGINIFSYYFVPLTDSIEDEIATQRANDFYIGWFWNPLIFGDYPDIMKKNAGSRIPAFTVEESDSIRGSFDFLGLNYYNVMYVEDKSSTLQSENRDVVADIAIKLHCQRTRRNSTLEDRPRVEYLQAHVGTLLDTIGNGSNVKGYFTWSLLDYFEMLDGYESGYGLYYVDLDDPDLKRQPKLSAHWYSDFLKRKEKASL
ncbi:hypothetical protein TIFTF001_039103 [Ficus carica]|uniref:Beta-glucosidase 11-like n=1 Tax=Ficus carica TaxID=3494 RepID=A0AA88E8J0_FICCA|nr:hypothetical protein TIFTF001_039103 [Ficus carica]